MVDIRRINYKKTTKKAICTRCGEEYKYSKKKGLKYNMCRKCTIYTVNLNRRKDAIKNHICITCFKRPAKEIKCPHCKKAIFYSPRCSECIKDNGKWTLSKLAPIE